MASIAPRTSTPTVQANLTSRGMTSSEREDLMRFWLDRYENAPDLRVRDGYTNKPVHSAGGQGLFIASRHVHAAAQIDPHDPEHPVNKDFAKRQTQLRNEMVGATSQDKQRLALLSKVEKCAHEHWKYDALHQEAHPGAADRAFFYSRSAKFRQDMGQAMEALLTYDRQHGHPVAEANRDFKSEPVRQQEQYDWANRNGRTMASSERTALMVQGFDVADRQAPIKLAPRVCANQPWYIDNGTQEKINARTEYEKGLDRDLARAHVPGLPENAQHPSTIQQVVPEQQGLAKARQQIEFINGASARPGQDPHQLMAGSIRQAAAVDPQLARNLIQASKQDKGMEAMEAHMRQVNDRVEQVQAQVDAGDVSVKPLRASDVILAHGQRQANLIAENKGQAVEVESRQVGQAATQGQAGGMSRQSLGSLSDRLRQRREGIDPERPILHERLDRAQREQENLRKQLAQIEQGNEKVRSQLGGAKVEAQEKREVLQAYKAVEAKLAKQNFEMDSIRQIRQVDRQERQAQAPKIERPRPAQQRMPEPGGFDRWWSSIKAQAVQFKQRAGDLLHGQQPAREASRPSTTPRRTIPKGPGASLAQASQRKPQVAQAQQAPIPAPVGRDERMAQLRAQLSRRPTGPGSMMGSKQANNEGRAAQRPQQGPTVAPSVRTRPTGPSIGLGR